jgi:hypothetical protein
MNCNECLKELNEMTLYCDRCGAQVAKEKMSLTFEEVEKQVLPIVIESPYGTHHQMEIRNAYFLSNIRKDFKGFKRQYIEQYIDYVLLFTYYMKNRVHLTTSEFDPKKALAVLNTFYERKPDPIVSEILAEEYGDDYTNRIIPKNVTDRIEKLYLSDFNLNKISTTKFLPKIILSTVKGMLKVGILFAIIGAVIYFGVPTIDLMGILLGNPIILGGLLIVLAFFGYLITKKDRQYLAFEDIINRNDYLKKQIKTDMKKRIKTIKYRLKKSKK